MTISEQKIKLRNYIKNKKLELSIEQKVQLSDLIFKQLEKLPQFINAKVILAYWSMDDEVQTHNFILKWSNSKKIVLPVVKNNELELREFSGIEHLHKCSSFDVLEPHTGKEVAEGEIDLVIVPGVAFDKKGNRLGRGKAYYDKLLRNYNVYKIGICFDLQFVSKVPVGEHDVKMDIIIKA